MRQKPASHLETFGLASWQGRFVSMERAHRHQEVELNWVQEGALTYVYAGAEVTIPAQSLALFWGALPHQVIRGADPTRCTWITLPLGIFLRWQRSSAMGTALLSGRVIVDASADYAVTDALMFARWHHDLHSDSTQLRRIVLLEIEARLARLALAHEHDSAHPADNAAGKYQSPREQPRQTAVATMAQYIHAHFQQPLQVGEIAATAGLNPNYAMSLYRQTYGMTIVETITQYRIALAQRMLMTTSESVLSIALECGLGSVSQFYHAFNRLCGKSPARYRAALYEDGVHTPVDAPEDDMEAVPLRIPE